MDSTPFSTATLTSSFRTSGNSALMKYSLSSSAISTSGDHSATVMVSSLPSLRRSGEPVRREESRFCSSFISLKGSQPLKGSQRVNPVITILSFLSGWGHLTADRHPLTNPNRLLRLSRTALAHHWPSHKIRVFYVEELCQEAERDRKRKRLNSS